MTIHVPLWLILFASIGLSAYMLFAVYIIIGDAESFFDEP